MSATKSGTGFSFKLKKKRVRNNPAMRIRANGVFEPIVDRDLFEAAQAIIRGRSRRLSNEEMLDVLERLFQARGYLSGLIIDEADHLPSSSAYQSRFGSLLRAYQLVGFTPGRDYRYIEINRALREMPALIVEDCLVMSLVENCARRQHRAIGTPRFVKSSKSGSRI